MLVLGVGNILRGDDAFGPLVVEKLKKKNISIDVLDCGSQPENFLEIIKKKNPDKLIICDTINKNQEDTIKVFTSDEIKEKTFSTHNIPLSFLEKYLETKIIFIGFPTEKTEFNTRPSKECLKAVEKAVETIKSYSKTLNNNFKYISITK